MSGKKRWTCARCVVAHYSTNSSVQHFQSMCSEKQFLSWHWNSVHSTANTTVFL